MLRSPLILCLIALYRSLMTYPILSYADICDHIYCPSLHYRETCCSNEEESNESVSLYNFEELSHSGSSFHSQSPEHFLSGVKIEPNVHPIATSTTADSTKPWGDDAAYANKESFADGDERPYPERPLPLKIDISTPPLSPSNSNTLARAQDSDPAHSPKQRRHRGRGRNKGSRQYRYNNDQSAWDVALQSVEQRSLKISRLLNEISCLLAKAARLHGKVFDMVTRDEGLKCTCKF